MDTGDYIDALRRDGDRIVAVAEAGLERPVPSCSGWNVAELIWHVGNVHTFWRQVAEGVVAGPDGYREPARPGDHALVQWFGAGLDDTVKTLADIDPERSVWTWGRRQDVGFIQRRVAHETAIHRWDASGAVGLDESIEPPLAADGVAEFFEEVLPGMSCDLHGPAQTIALRCNDIGAEWTVRAGEGVCELVAFGHADAIVRASASDLVLLLWGRRRMEQVHIDGDRGAVQRLLARATF